MACESCHFFMGKKKNIMIYNEAHITIIEEDRKWEYFMKFQEFMEFDFDDVVRIEEDTFIHGVEVCDGNERRILKYGENFLLKELLVHSLRVAARIAGKIQVSGFKKDVLEYNEKYNQDLKKVINIFAENIQKLSSVDRAVMWGVLANRLERYGYAQMQQYFKESTNFVGLEPRGERFTILEIRELQSREISEYFSKELSEKNLKISSPFLNALKEVTVKNPGIMNMWLEPRKETWLRDRFDNDVELLDFLTHQKVGVSIFMSNEAEEQYVKFLENLKGSAFQMVLEKVKKGVLRDELKQCALTLEAYKSWDNPEKENVFIKAFEDYLRKPYITNGGVTFSSMLHRIGCNSVFLEKIEKGILSNNLFEIKNVEESKFAVLVLNKEVAFKIMLLNHSQYYDLIDEKDFQFSNVLEGLEMDDKEMRNDFRFKELGDTLNKLSRVINRVSLETKEGKLFDYEKDGGVSASNEVRGMRITLRDMVDKLFKERLNVFYKLVGHAGFKVKSLESAKNSEKDFATEEILVEKEDIEAIKSVLKKMISFRESKLYQYVEDLSMLNTEKIMKKDLENVNSCSNQKLKIRKF